jgi:hypothetical protein
MTENSWGKFSKWSNNKNYKLMDPETQPPVEPTEEVKEPVEETV